MPTMTRRQFNRALLGSAAAFALPRMTPAETTPTLVAGQARVRLAPGDYPETEVWAYGGTVPGATIRLPQGGRVTRRFVNELPQASSVHWHGIRIENAMDGVAGLTQAAVEPGDDFLYDFTVRDAGTYWYHPHNRSWEQMARGLSGALIVDEAEGAPDVDMDEVLLIDDWRMTDRAEIAEDFGAIHDWAHAGRIGNWITVNGDGAWSREVQAKARLRLRLVNTANARIFSLGAKGLEGWAVALDGMPLDKPEPLDRLTLAPAQRVDLLVDVTADDGDEALLVSSERDGDYALAAFPVRGAARTARLAEPGPLPPNPVATLGPLNDARRAELLMEGGAMGGMRSAMMGGQMMDMRDMAAAGKVWAFNGMADMDETPFIEADRGETIRIAMTNDTAWPHAMHLHGHHFHRVAEDGSLGPLRDTLLMDRGETAEIAFVADNPVDWLLHCHMLEHSAGGMMTWLRVA
ncbi:multicopper oxidase family protein [Palleronia pelagia]|uniref:Multicopper oxidase with three cupredoxin domains (Includes cell division protein FtsP and spore coat protein CotA) n=1 Tax=Palleronia pelagia TaxID=387096 RepID=A0A1H8IR71_9RHOB|nr:multicopper oxidase family protein [Palleronia pelagia]SEN70496.1 Multicopper oxidase with three cupredoxin domains (includes cell division protein FtsP and spore coat protein CotA) [Palleronia pelagia]